MTSVLSQPGLGGEQHRLFSACCAEHVDFFVTFIIHLVLRFCQENSRTNPRKMRIHPAESEEGEKRSGQTASKASFRSSRISSMCSVPIERRIVFGLMP